jgi:hypothetical protein
MTCVSDVGREEIHVCDVGNEVNLVSNVRIYVTCVNDVGRKLTRMSYIGLEMTVLLYST